MSQHTKLLNLLDDSRWHCSNELRDLFVPEYRSRINELRKCGYVIKALKCNLHKHSGNMQMWRIFEKPASQDTPQTEQKRIDDAISTKATIRGCCWHRDRFGYCEHEKIILKTLF